MAQSGEKVFVAGDVTIENVTIVTLTGFAQTVVPQVVGIEIYEDIFSSFITGKLYLKDAQDLQNLLPLVGEEVLRLIFKTPKLDDRHAYSGEYFIFKLDDKVKLKEREVAYVLHFISKEAVTDINRKVSKAYSGKVSSIVEEICTKVESLRSEKELNIEETSNDIKFVSNFWSPTKCLQRCADYALNENNSPSYVFFENKHGLNFVSLDSLYTGTPIFQRFVMDNYSNEISPSGGSSRDLNKDYQRILELRTPETYNYMDRIKSGMYGSEIITYDLMTRQYVHTAYAPNFEESNHLNSYPLFSASPPGSQKAVLIQGRNFYNNFEGYGDVTDSKFIQKRISLLAQAEAYKITITVHGRTDYTAGQRVYVEIPKNAQVTDKTDDMDKIMSGNYLVAAICHYVTRSTHRCIMELVKDSFMIDLDNPDATS